MIISPFGRLEMFVPVWYVFVWTGSQPVGASCEGTRGTSFCDTQFIPSQPFFSPLSMIRLLPADKQEAPQAPSKAPSTVAPKCRCVKVEVILLSAAVRRSLAEHLC